MPWRPSGTSWMTCQPSSARRSSRVRTELPALGTDAVQVDGVPVVAAQPGLQRGVVRRVQRTDAGRGHREGELGDVRTQVGLRGATQTELEDGVVRDDLTGLQVDRTDPAPGLLRDEETVGAIAPPPPHGQDIFHASIIGTARRGLQHSRPSGRHSDGVSPRRAVAIPVRVTRT